MVLCHRLAKLDGKLIEKCHMAGLAKIAGDGMYSCDIFPLKTVHKKEVQGRTNNPPTLRSNVTGNVVKHRTRCWVDILWGQYVTRTL